MNWYYAEENQQKGPVSESELDQLFQRGRISGATLIWKEGMAVWEPYSKARGAAQQTQAGVGEVVCSQCGQIFNADEVIRYGDKAVCASCKPVFLQKLREGTPLDKTGYEIADVGMRLLAKMLDGVIVFIGIFVTVFIIAFFVGFFMARRGGRPDDSFAIMLGLLMYAMAFGLMIFYNTFFIAAYGATPGKMICKIKVIRPDGGKVSYGRAFCRCLAEYLSSVFLIGYLMAIFDDQKRSLHDRICDTLVVRN